ncbi:MAG: diacylglycerol kinase family protein [Flavisolibacter sp.]
MTSKENIFDSTAPPFSFKARLKSFRYAWEGIVSFFRWEHNAQIHLVVTILVAILSLALKLANWEAVAVVFSVALVWVAEMFNTVVEKTMDYISTATHPQVKMIKDIAAGAVLITAIAALIVGCIVFIPKLLAL